MSVLRELKRRNVLRVGAAYVVTAWLIIQVVETIFPAFGFGDEAVRVVVILLAIGLIPATIFAWAFELTPQGLKREKDVDRSQSITPQTGKRLDRMIMLVLALALAYFAFDKFVLDPARDLSREAVARQEGRSEALVESFGDRSIAVLPFINMSSDEEQAYFSDGISEELLNLLGKIPGLRVISRTSAFSFREKDVEISEIAEKLNVANVLEGSVRKSGSRVRVTVQLIEARSDTHLWSETYDRQLDDIFAIQDEIAAEVVDQLKISLLGATPRAQEVNSEAYTLSLQARYLSRMLSATALDQAEELYKEALFIDPGFTDAWYGLAMNYLRKENNNFLPGKQAFLFAREAAERILEVDSDSAEAQDLLGFIAMRGENDLAQAAFHYQKALESAPFNEVIIRHVAALLQLLNRVDESVALTEDLLSRDPVNPVLQFNLGIAYYRAKRWNESIAAFETALKLAPDIRLAHGYIGANLLFKGETKAALEEMTKEKSERRRILGTALANYSLGRFEEYEAGLAQFVERWGTEQPHDVARAYAFVGNNDRAFHWLDRAIEMQQPGLSRELVTPFYQSIHSDPRWESFLERIGSSPEQLSAIEFKLPLP